jgi:hypothetical protein
MPPVPHAPSLVPAWQLLFESQQPAQLAGLHAGFSQRPPSQTSPVTHGSQRSPFAPHCVVDVPAWQLPFASQHPPQLLELQSAFWHSPPLQKSF